MKEIRRYAAAGGVVIAAGKVLLLDRPRRNEVRLPKGHIEEGESAREAALREVTEETGYADLIIVADLGARLVEFDYGEIQYARTETYFLMQLASRRTLERNAADALDFHVLWVDLEAAVARLTYASEQEVVEEAIALAG